MRFILPALLLAVALSPLVSAQKAAVSGAESGANGSPAQQSRAGHSGGGHWRFCGT